MNKIWQEDFKTLDELIPHLKKHSYWKQVNIDVFSELFKNAKNDQQRIRDFLIVSEEYDLVGNNFIEIAREEDTKEILGLMAITLCRLGDSLMEGYPYSNLSDDDLKGMVGMAELSYRSSILCDPYWFQSYYGLIFCCCVFIDKIGAFEYKRDFEIAKGKLLSADIDTLNDFQKAAKENTDMVQKTEMAIDSLLERF